MVMQRVAWWMIALSVASSTPSCQGEKESSCIGSINEIYESEREVVDIDRIRRYTLCPNTVYQIATEYGDDDVPIDGDRPIVFGRPNVHVVCGENGRSSNNCTLSGGLLHLGIFDEFPGGGVSAYNCEARGITFTGAQSVNVLADFHGEVAFDDCIFKDNSNRASIFVQAPEAGTLARRRLRSFLFGRHNPPFELLSAPHYHSLSIIVNNSQFVDNTVRTHSWSAGLITKTDASLRVERCVFVKNRFVGSKKESSYIIANKRGRLVLHENDFLANQVLLAPVVNEYGSVTHESNRIRVNEESKAQMLCDFIVNVKEGTLGQSPLDEMIFSCEGVE